MVYTPKKCFLKSSGSGYIGVGEFPIIFECMTQMFMEPFIKRNFNFYLFPQAVTMSDVKGVLVLNINIF